MKLISELAALVQQIEAELDVSLTDADFADGRKEILHVFLHEACHAALSSRAAWIHDLPEEQHTTVDEVLARLLEDHVAARLGLPAHTPEEHVRELQMYPVTITVEQYRHLREEWRQTYGPAKDPAGTASYAIEYLFPDR